VSLLLLLLAAQWSRQLMALPFEIVGDISPEVWSLISDFQASVLDRFDHSLKHPVPMLCLRFGMDEALVALCTSRVLVKPARVLTFLTAWMAAGGGLVWLALWPIGLWAGVLTGFLDFVLGSHLKSLLGPIFVVPQVFAGILMSLSILPMIVFLIVWAILGYLMGSLTIGHWGGFVAQLLADFRITAVPEGAAATSRVHSPWVLRRGLRHSLVYTDPHALAEISEWVVARMIENGRTISV
jgi:hypothetical protein